MTMLTKAQLEYARERLAVIECAARDRIYNDRKAERNKLLDALDAKKVEYVKYAEKCAANGECVVTWDAKWQELRVETPIPQEDYVETESEALRQYERETTRLKNAVSDRKQVLLDRIMLFDANEVLKAVEDFSAEYSDETNRGGTN